MFQAWFARIEEAVRYKYPVEVGQSDKARFFRYGGKSITLHDLGDRTAALVLSPPISSAQDASPDSVWREAPRHAVDDLSVRDVVAAISGHFASRD